MNSNSKKLQRYKFSAPASRSTSISVPVFGVSWQPSDSERKIIRSLLLFLEDRRVLYNDFAHEIKHQVAESVLQIRTTLTNSIQLLPDNSQATFHLRDMRAACREYLDNSNNRYAPPFRFLAHLGRLRTIFGYHIAKLAVME